MSKPLHRRAAANAFAHGSHNIRTHSALTFVGDVAWSYAEPIAIRRGNHLFVTETRFSVTTSGHIGTVHGAWNVARAAEGIEPPYNVTIVPHGRLRHMTQKLGQGYALGYWGDRLQQQWERSILGREAVAA